MKWSEVKLSAALAAVAMLSSIAASRAACLPTNPDVAIYGVEMGDALSATLQLGGKYNLIESEDSLPYAVFTNSAETEVLKLYRNFGDAADTFNLAEVLATEDLDSDEEATVLDTAKFRTGRGVHLGMSKSALFDLFGACTLSPESEPGFDLYRYELSDPTASDLLRSHNMPLYYAEYAFKDDKLARFAFGFTYP